MASQSQEVDGIPSGQLKPSSTWGDFNNTAFVISQLLNKLQTATIVKIVSCTNSGDLSPVGYVDVIPMVNQTDGQGNPVPHVTIFNVPYFRLQGGANAVIIDPEPGDIGIAVFASRDITKVKNTKTSGNPGSARKYNFADALYIGGILNNTPTQYVQFNTAGIKVHSPNNITLDAPDILLSCQTFNLNATTRATITTPIFTVNASDNATINAKTNINGNTTVTGSVTQAGGAANTFSGDVTAQGTSVHTHRHGGVMPGGGQTSGPV